MLLHQFSFYCWNFYSNDVRSYSLSFSILRRHCFLGSSHFWFGYKTSVQAWSFPPFPEALIAPTKGNFFCLENVYPYNQISRGHDNFLFCLRFFFSGWNFLSGTGSFHRIFHKNNVSTWSWVFFYIILERTSCIKKIILNTYKRPNSNFIYLNYWLFKKII